MTQKKRVVTGAAVALAALAALAIVISSSAGGSSNSASGDSTATSTAAIERGRLTTQVSATGTLTYAAQADGSPYAIVNQATGVLTALPRVGGVIKCGRTLYRVHGRPVLMLCGNTPLYRPLSEGMKGWDVKELNRNLIDLGYADGAELEPSGYFGSETGSALKALKIDRGLKETGSLGPDQAVALPGPLRISSLSATLGAPAQKGAPIAAATSTARLVEVDLDPPQAEGIKSGDRASITLPSNRTTPGVVRSVGATAVDSGSDANSGSGSSTDSGSGAGSGGGSGSATPMVAVLVALRHPGDLGRVQEAPVRVAIVTGRIRNALSVPVTALLARPGGYAVETVDATGQRKLVPVNLGEFDDANGLVQVSGPGLTAGQRVVVPST